jgi:hypothetical protein
MTPPGQTTEPIDTSLGVPMQQGSLVVDDALGQQHTSRRVDDDAVGAPACLSRYLPTPPSSGSSRRDYRRDSP